MGSLSHKNVPFTLVSTSKSYPTIPLCQDLPWICQKTEAGGLSLGGILRKRLSLILCCDNSFLIRFQSLFTSAIP